MKDSEKRMAAVEPMFVCRSSFFSLLADWLRSTNDTYLNIICEEMPYHLSFIEACDEPGRLRERREFLCALADRSVQAWKTLLAHVIELNDMDAFMKLKPLSPFEDGVVVRIEWAHPGLLHVRDLQDFAVWFKETRGKTTRANSNTLIISQPRTC